LWGYTSTTHLYRVVKERPLLSFVLGEAHRLPTYASYRTFVRRLTTSTEWPRVKTMLSLVVAQQPTFPNQNVQWDDWLGLLDNSHQLRDPGARLNYCASKNLTYYGREGVVLGDAFSELPLVLFVQASARIGKSEFKAIMERADELLSRYRQVEKVLGDGEFDTDANEERCRQTLGARLVCPIKTAVNMARRLPPSDWKKRTAGERVISRGEEMGRVQRPPVLGDR